MIAVAPLRSARPRNSLMLALAASLALHGVVLGAVLWLGGTGTPVPVPAQMVAMVMIEAPDAKPVDNAAPASTARHQPAPLVNRPRPT